MGYQGVFSLCCPRLSILFMVFGLYSLHIGSSQMVESPNDVHVCHLCTSWCANILCWTFWRVWNPWYHDSCICTISYYGCWFLLSCEKDLGERKMYLRSKSCLNHSSTLILAGKIFQVLKNSWTKHLSITFNEKYDFGRFFSCEGVAQHLHFFSVCPFVYV